jgi:integrase
MSKIRKTKGIYRRGRVYWITYMGLDGKQKYESTGSDLKADAELILAQRRVDVDQGKEPVTRRRDRNHTFNQLADKYKAFVINQKSAKTKEVFIEQLRREFGSVKLSNISLSAVEVWQVRRLTEERPSIIQGGVNRPPVKPATVNRTLGCLKHMFTKALDWEMITEDVFKRIKKAKMTPENNRRLRYLSFEESAALLNSCDKHLKPIVTLALNTGCRRGEILGLTWDRVDLKHGFILLDDTKSGKRREIPINANVRAVLQGIVRRLDSPFVFVNPETVKERPPVKEGSKKRPASGRYFDVKKSFTTACRKAKLQDFHFHDLRHTFASQLVMNGVDITTVSRLLGHATLTMTLRYAHLAPDHLQNAVDVLSRLSTSHDNLHDIGVKTA